MTSFDSWPILVVFLATLGLILGVLDLGYRIGQRRQRRATGKAEGAGAMVGATMGLLAFMLAFTFNAAATRHEARKALVVEEANAIDQTWLRAGFLPEAARLKARETLRAYVDLRIKVANGEVELESGLKQNEQLLNQLWTVAEQASLSQTSPIPTSQFADSANRVISLHVQRLTMSIRNRVPPTIWASLYVLAGLAMLMMGIANGLGLVRQVGVEVALAVAFSIVLIVIADLDRPQRGLINVSQQALIELRDRIDAR